MVVSKLLKQSSSTLLQNCRYLSLYSGSTCRIKDRLHHRLDDCGIRTSSIWSLRILPDVLVSFDNSDINNSGDVRGKDTEEWYCGVNNLWKNQQHPFFFFFTSSSSLKWKLWVGLRTNTSFLDYLWLYDIYDTLTLSLKTIFYLARSIYFFLIWYISAWGDGYLRSICWMLPEHWTLFLLMFRGKLWVFTSLLWIHLLLTSLPLCFIDLLCFLLAVLLCLFLCFARPIRSICLCARNCRDLSDRIRLEHRLHHCNMLLWQLWIATGQLCPISGIVCLVRGLWQSWLRIPLQWWVSSRSRSCYRWIAIRDWSCRLLNLRWPQS